MRARVAHVIGNLIWAVNDTGWTYQLKVTSDVRNEWHGYLSFQTIRLLVRSGNCQSSGRQVEIAE